MDRAKANQGSSRASVGGKPASKSPFAEVFLERINAKPHANPVSMRAAPCKPFFPIIDQIEHAD